MPLKKKTSSQSEAESEGQLSKEQQNQKRKRLFMQQLEKEAQERINEMEGTLEQLLKTADQVFRVEMMKLPPAMQCTVINDLMCEADTPVGEVTIAIKNESTEINQPLTRKSSKKGQTNASAQRLKRTLSVQSKKTTKESKMTKSRSLVSSSESKMSGAATTSTTKRTQGRVAKLSDLSSVTRNQMRCRNLGLWPSDPDTVSTTPMATATVSTAHGATFLLSDNIKDHIDIGMLDDTAVHQMQQLRQLMDYLCKKVELSNVQ